MDFNNSPNKNVIPLIGQNCQKLKVFDFGTPAGNFNSRKNGPLREAFTNEIVEKMLPFLQDLEEISLLSFDCNVKIIEALAKLPKFSKLSKKKKKKRFKF